MRCLVSSKSTKTMKYNSECFVLFPSAGVHARCKALLQKARQECRRGALVSQVPSMQPGCACSSGPSMATLIVCLCDLAAYCRC